LRPHIFFPHITSYFTQQAILVVSQLALYRPHSLKNHVKEYPKPQILLVLEEYLQCGLFVYCKTSLFLHTQENYQYLASVITT